MRRSSFSLWLLTTLAIARGAVAQQLDQPTPAPTPPNAAESPDSAASPLSGRPILQAMDPAARMLGNIPHADADQRKRIDSLVGSVVDPSETLDLVLGRPRLLQLKRVPKRVQIPDEEVASYDLLSDAEVSVVGKRVGTTILNLWFADPTAPGGMTLLSYLVRVFPDPQAPVRLQGVYKAIEDQINAAFADAKVTLSLVGDNVIVRGEAKTSNDVTQIMRIVDESVPGASADIPADVTTGAGTPPGSVGASGVRTPGIRDYFTGGNYRNEGTSASGRTPQQRGADGSPRIINMMRVPGENQVMLKVTVAEVNRSAARSIGLNFAIRGSSGNAFGNFTGDVLSSTNGGLGGGTLRTGANLPMLLDNGQVAVALQALRDVSLAKSLAEPNLVAVNGQTASFQAGGQFPVPIVTGATATGLQGVTFVPFGVQLAFTPYITDRDRIRLVLAGDVSTRNASIGSVINGASVSGVDTRNFQTTVDLKPGQSLAIAGLIQQNYGASASRVPFFGDLPILSALFGSQSTSAAEQELVVLVTADLVSPMDPGDVPPLPGSEIFDPSDAEFYLRGQLESDRAREFRSARGTDAARLARLDRLQKLYIAGPSGYSNDAAVTGNRAGQTK